MKLSLFATMGKIVLCNQGPFSISYLESSNLASHLASSSIPSNLWGFLSLIS